MLKQKDLIYSLNWDILIILDACRYDYFEKAINEVNIKYSKLLKVESSGSCTMEWFIHTFDRRIPNSIYISGNPYIGNYRNEFNGIFYDPRAFFDRVKPVYLKAWRKINDIYVIEPYTIMRVALTNMMMRPRKKIIIHFMQPHAPYPHAIDLKKYFVNDIGKPDMLLWMALEHGLVPVEKVKQAYYDNLLWILGVIKPILNFPRRRRIIITSDHGECFGEKGLYNHPCGEKIEELIHVPWCIIY